MGPNCNCCANTRDGKDKSIIPKKSPKKEEKKQDVRPFVAAAKIATPNPVITKKERKYKLTAPAAFITL